MNLLDFQSFFALELPGDLSESPNNDGESQASLSEELWKASESYTVEEEVKTLALNRI